MCDIDDQNTKYVGAPNSTQTVFQPKIPHSGVQPI